MASQIKISIQKNCFSLNDAGPNFNLIINCSQKQRPVFYLSTKKINLFSFIF